MNKSIQDYAKENSWTTKMANPKGLDSFSNYSGSSLGDLVVVAGIGRNRDSEIMDESNFDKALELLGGESKTIQVHCFGHWACGWFELITVDPKDKKALAIAAKITQDLKEYPVLDDDDYFEREYEYQESYAESAKESVAKVLVKLFDLPEELESDSDILKLAVAINIECQRYYGNDSCVMGNEFHVDRFDERDFDKYVTCLKQMQYSHIADTECYKFICACFCMDLEGK